MPLRLSRKWLVVLKNKSVTREGVYWVQETFHTSQGRQVEISVRDLRHGRFIRGQRAPLSRESIESHAHCFHSHCQSITSLVLS
jgi:hypothetical protein